MSQSEMNKIVRPLSIAWDALCIVLSWGAGQSAIERLLFYKRQGVTLEGTLKKMFEDPEAWIHLAHIGGAAICLIGAVIHLVLFLRRKEQLAKKYRLIQNLGAFLVLISGTAHLIYFLSHFDSAPG
jgi:hypothetical protein